MLAVWSITSNFSSAVPLTSLLPSNKSCPTGESYLRCSSTFVAKCLTVWPTQVELHLNFHTTLDLSSRAMEVLRVKKHIFNFLVAKIICATDFLQTFATNS